MKQRWIEMNAAHHTVGSKNELKKSETWTRFRKMCFAAEKKNNFSLNLPLNAVALLFIESFCFMASQIIRIIAIIMQKKKLKRPEISICLNWLQNEQSQKRHYQRPFVRWFTSLLSVEWSYMPDSGDNFTQKNNENWCFGLFHHKIIWKRCR